MKCIQCKSENIISIIAECSTCVAVIGDDIQKGSVPTNIGLGSNPNEIKLKYCHDCGQIQSKFPLSSVVKQTHNDNVSNITPNITPNIIPVVVETPIIELIDKLLKLICEGSHSEYEVGRILSTISSVVTPQDMNMLYMMLEQIPQLLRANLSIDELLDTVEYIKQNYNNSVITQTFLTQK